MRITDARLQGCELVLTLSDPAEAARAVYRFKAGEYELQKVKRKRSLDANAYCWVLIGAIARKIHEPETDVYRRYIRDVGPKTSMCCVQMEDLETEVNGFVSGHLGRTVEIGESKLPGCATVKKIYGSSDFDTRQMADFLDYIIQDCAALDIETRPQEEIDSLLEQWEGRHGQERVQSLNPAKRGAVLPMRAERPEAGSARSLWRSLPR